MEILICGGCSKDLFNCDCGKERPFKCDWPGCTSTKRHLHLSQICDPTTWNVEGTNDAI